MAKLLTVEEYGVLELLSRLPDDVWLTVEEAALVLRLSVSTLNKMRMGKKRGPVYSQGGETGASGDNQRVLYQKADLLAWRESQKVTDTHAAAVRKGQMFRTVADLMEPVAVWTKDGEICGLAGRTPLDIFIQRVSMEPREWEVEWMPAIEAASRQWDDPAGHAGFAAEVKTALGNLSDAVSAALDASAVSAAVKG